MTMAKLTPKQRSAAPKLLPDKGMFPVPDKEHAALAAQMAPKALHAGSITKMEEQHVINAAHKMLGLKHKPAAGKKWR